MTDFVTLTIAASKLVDYLLDLDHPVGRSKARFFIGRGFAREDPGLLAKALNVHLTSPDTEKAVMPAPDGRSEKRIVAVGPLCPDGSRPLVKAIWRVAGDETTAAFLTAYPARRGAAG